jgi:protein involved in temperature-dependent protein secretion
LHLVILALERCPCRRNLALGLVRGLLNSAPEEAFRPIFEEKKTMRWINNHEGQIGSFEVVQNGIYSWSPIEKLKAYHDEEVNMIFFCNS